MHSRRLRVFVLLLVGLMVLAACGVDITAVPPAATPAGRVSPSPTTRARPPASVTQPAPSGGHTLFVLPDDGTAPVVSAIDGAHATVEMKMYLLTERTVIDALSAAAKRGVQVRVMLEQHPYGGGNNQSVYDALGAAGISVNWTNPVFRLTHEKSLVIDGTAAFIMTANMTHSAFVNNREYGIISTQEAEVQEVLKAFNADWNRQQFTPASGSPLLWSNATSRPKILAFIDGAQQTLLMEQEEMQDQQVQQHLVAAAKRGVKIRVLVAAADSSSADSNLPGEQQVAAGEVAVRTITSPYMHAKIYVADGGRAIVGSINVSTSSLDNNRELGIALSDPAIVQRLSQTFEKDWLKGKDVK